MMIAFRYGRWAGLTSGLMAVNLIGFESFQFHAISVLFTFENGKHENCLSTGGRGAWLEEHAIGGPMPPTGH
jgi:hypothetical protein